MMVTDMGTPGGLDRAVHLAALMTLNFDLDGRVVDLELMVKFTADRTQNLLPLTNGLFGNEDVAAAVGDLTLPELYRQSRVQFLHSMREV